MLNTKNISKILDILDQEYNRHVTSPELEYQIMYSKLGILELSGWVEEQFDRIVLHFIPEKIQSHEICTILKDRIDRTYGFSYDKHFRKLLIIAVGTVRLLKIEEELNKDGSLSQLRSELETLHKQRNSAAHTFIKDTILSFDAPSVTRDRFRKIEPILKNLCNMASPQK